MTPEERELRRALAARSGSPSPDLQSRVSAALEHDLPVARVMPAVALAVGAILTITSVGVLMAVRHNLESAGRPNHGGPASAARVSPTPPPVVLPTTVTLSSASAKVVWAFVDDRLLYVSTDAGASWQQRSTPPNLAGSPHAISFLDANNGWAMFPSVPGTCGGGGARLWRTTDGARTWQLASEVDFQAQALGGAQLQDCKDTVTFTDSTHGYVTTWNDGSRPAVWRTSNGGKTWSESIIADPPDFKTQAGGYYLRLGAITRFGGELMASAYGMQPGGVLRGYMFESVDGGATWSATATLPSSTDVVAVVTAERWLHVVPGSGSMETTDAGRSWHAYATDYDQAAGVPPQIVFASSFLGYATVRGSIQRTTDGGAHWTYVATPGVANPSRSPSPPPSPVPSGPPLVLPTTADLSAPSPGVVWALVGGVKLFVSADRGATWSQRSLPRDLPYSEISFVNDREGWLTLEGPAGTQCSFGSVMMWHTTDGAATWQLVIALGQASAPSGLRLEQCKQGLSFVDSTHGFYAAWDDNSRPTVYHTADGGQTWTGSTLPDPSGFKTQAGGDTLRAGLVRDFGGTLLVDAYGMQPDGLHGYVFQSTDGGTTWAPVATLPDTTDTLAFVSAARWLFIVPNGSAETTDAGQTWHAFTSDYQQAAGVPPQLLFAGSAVGYATVRGSIQRTDDGGAHWTSLQTPGVVPPG